MTPTLAPSPAPARTAHWTSCSAGRRTAGALLTASAVWCSWMNESRAQPAKASETDEQSALPATPANAPTTLARRLEAVEAELRALKAAQRAPDVAPSNPAVATNEEPLAEPASHTEPTEEVSERVLTRIGLLPLEFAALGDLYYAVASPGEDGFHIGAVEIDPTFQLSPYVSVAAAIAYSGADDSFSLPAFVVDCSLFGKTDDYPLRSSFVTRSGVSFGRFDVPFGVAYLEYPSVSNRLMQVPNAVNATHGSWNDLGAQAHAETDDWTAMLYVVNGSQFEEPLFDVDDPRLALGARLSIKLNATLDIGGSHAQLLGFGAPFSFSGGDISANLGGLDLRGEYILRHQVDDNAPDDTHGAYGRGVYDLDPVFLVARYDTVFTARALVDRRAAGGVAVEVFPRGEVRVIYEQNLDAQGRMVWFQLVGGSNFQPTGLRR